MKAQGRCCALIAAILIFYYLPADSQQTRQTLARHVPQAVSTGAAKPLGLLPSTQRLNISMVLPLRNQKQLIKLLSRIYDPSSPDYHHYLTVAEFTDQFAPSELDFQSVVDYAEANGMTVTSRPANRVVISISGTVEQIQNAFHVAMKVYQHPTEDRTFFSSDREPSLALNVPIAHIAGLNNFSIPHSMATRRIQESGLAGDSVQGSGPGGTYLPSDMRAAYYAGTGLTGAGQTVALLQFDGYDIADVVGNLNGAATAITNGGNYVLTYTPAEIGVTYTIPVNNVLCDGATGQPVSGDDSEEALDIAQLVGMAPGLNQIRVYIGNLDADLLSAIASDNSARQVSISWSWTPDDPAVDDPFFEEFAAQGQSVFVASGDYGAYSPSFTAYYPAEDDWVTSVGGTHLSTNGAGGSWNSETAWTRSGGGISPDEMPMPGWQSGIATSSNQASSSFRNVPDVAMEADFDNYSCTMGKCSGGWGGTSFAAPRWAGFMALLHQQAVANNAATMGFFNIALYGVAEGSDYDSSFHDVSSGDNGYSSGFSFNAEPGYDLVTGWGSPNGQNLIDAFAPSASAGLQIEASPSVLALSPGTTASIAINVIRAGNATSPVSLSISGLPKGVSGKFAPLSTTGSSTLTLAAGDQILGGTAFPQISGSSGTFTATTNLSITLSAPLTVISIDSPAVPLAPVIAQTIKPGTVISVVGSIVGPYQNLSIQWAQGANPSGGWSTTGMTLNASSNVPLTNQPLGSWDTSSINIAGYFTIRVSANVSGANYAASTIVYLEPDLLSAAWPKSFNADSMDLQGPVPGVDAAGSTRVAFATASLGYHDGPSQDASQIRNFSADGASMLSLPFTQDGSWAQPAAGNLDMGAGSDIIGADSEDIEVFRPDGTSYVLSPDPSLGYLFFFGRAPIVEDVDGDSLLEVVAMGTEPTSGGNGGTPTGLAYVFAWRNDGTLLNSNFPFTVPDRNPTLASFEVPRVVVGDIDGDGAKEFVVIEGTSDGVITPRLFGANGLRRDWRAQPINGIPCQLSLADLDHNGELEIILMTCDGKLHILEPDGSERPGWPQSLPYSFGQVSIGDLNRDGHEEIVASSGNIYIFNADGTSFSGAWPMMGNYDLASEFFYGQAILADVNGDGFPEIVTSRFTYIPNGPAGLPNYETAKLIVLDRFGNTQRSWNLPGSEGEYPGELIYPLAGDLNQDGMTEIAVQYGLVSPCGHPPTTLLTMLATGAPFNADANDWPMINQNPQNTSVLRRTAGSTITIVPPGTPILANQPATFTLVVAAALPNANAPTGVANLLDGSLNIGTCVLVSGICSVSPTLGTGSHNLIAGYVGDTNFGVSYSADLVEEVEASAATTPTFSLAPGTYTSTQTVSISDSTPGEAIYYTTNGTTPTSESTPYSGPITVSSSVTIEAIATASGYSSSAVAMANYIITPPAAPPVFDPVQGTYTSTQTVAISSSTPGEGIYYTTNGTTPTTGSTLYSGPITVSSTETIETIAIASGYSQSPVSTAVYTIIPPAAAPVFNPAQGTYGSAQTVKIVDSTPGEAIYYTTDGTTPTSGSTLYSGPITVSSSEAIEAIATASGYSPSAVTSSVYNITPPVNASPVINSISPAFTDAGGETFKLTVTGSGFTSGAVVYWGGTALATQFVGATEVSAQVSATNIAGTGVTAVTVEIPGAGANQSNAQQFEVDSSSGSTFSPTFTTSLATAAPGSTANYPVSLPTSASGVSLSCLNLPANATCSYSSATCSVTISTTAETPSGTYQVTAVFEEAVAGTSSALVLVPIFLFPLIAVRKRWQARKVWLLAAFGIALTAGIATSCGGAGSPSETIPATHQVTSSGVVSIRVQ